jgi:hypothetical protein
VQPRGEQAAEHPGAENEDLHGAPPISYTFIVTRGERRRYVTQTGDWHISRYGLKSHRNSSDGQRRVGAR